MTQTEKQIIRNDPEIMPVVTPERRAFLDAAFEAHLGDELAGDLPAIVATYSKNGHLNFNGVIYDTPEQLTAFHRDFGFDGQGMIGGLEGEIVQLHHTYDSVIVEYIIRGTVEIALGDAPVGRSVAFPMCVIYQFDEAGKLASERVYADSGGLLPEPIMPISPRSMVEDPQLKPTLVTYE